MENKKDYYFSPNGVSTFALLSNYLRITVNDPYNSLHEITGFEGFLLGNIIKYLARNGKKENAYDDLEKATHYAEVYIEEADDDCLEVGDDFHTKVLANLLKGEQLQALNEFNKWRDEFEKMYVL